MEDLFPLLIFLLIIFGPLIERILRGGKKQEPPAEEQQRPAPQQRRPPMPRRGTESDEEAAQAGSAAEMLPDDLWAILTGERRPQRTEMEERPVARPRPFGTPERQPAPQARRRPVEPMHRPLPGRATPPAERPRVAPPAPARVEAPASWEEGTRRPVPREATVREEYVHEIPSYEPAPVVSMETVPLDAEARHTRFHDRVAGLAAPATVQKGPRASGHAALDSRVELRRAIILREILGPPKGLE